MHLLLLAVGCPSPTPPVDTEPVPTEDTGPVPDPAERPHPDCSAAPFAGEVFDCDTLGSDLWEAGFDARQACCACDASYCTYECPPYTGIVDNYDPTPPRESTGCEVCHGAREAGAPSDPGYHGVGTENPHPFGSSPYLPCHTCHGGDPDPLATKEQAHVPTPTELTDPSDPESAFRRATRIGVEDVDWLQFVDPGDLRVTAAARGCGMAGCHEAEHAAWVTDSPLATNTVLLSSIDHRLGLPHPRGDTHYGGTAGAWGATALVDGDFLALGGYDIGRVPELLAFPDLPTSIDPTLLAASLSEGPTLTDLAQFALAQVDNAPHLQAGSTATGTARGLGCSACHLPRRLDGTSTTRDPHVIDGAVEGPHPRDHRIASVAKDRATCQVLRGIPDTACASCHVDDGIFLQYWGLRLDEARDVVGGTQVPAPPLTWTTAADDGRLFDGNPTFATYTPDQLLLEEDYDGDGRDDTPPDVHQAAGMGCIDCHGSFDVHGSTDGSPVLGIQSHADDATGVTCASCHGDGETSLQPPPCVDYDGNAAECTVDRFDNALRNVVVQEDGRVVLRSRVTGRRHVVPQVGEAVEAGGHAALAMGRDAETGFSHLDVLACEACHAAWTPTRVGRLVTATPGASFSRVSGDPVGFVATQQVTYASPVFRTLGVGPSGKITLLTPDDLFFRYTDDTGESAVFTFTDRSGLGGVGSVDGRNALPALGLAVAATHSTRGAPTDSAEGVLGCPACHLTTDSTDTTDFGTNPGNTANQAAWVRANAGLGTGLFQFDASGCPVNGFDDRTDRPGCTTAPSANPAPPAFDLDRLVEPTGVENAGARQDRWAGVERDGALRPALVGPLGAATIERLTDPVTGIVLDTWYDADGVLHP